MKIQWDNTSKQKSDTQKSESGEKYEIDKITVSHSRSETFIRLKEKIIVMPPAAMKKLYLDLKKCITEWEDEFGEITTDSGKKKRSGSTPKKVLKALYKSRKVGSKLVSINTGKKKHLPPKGS